MDIAALIKKPIDDLQALMHEEIRAVERRAEAKMCRLMADQVSFTARAMQQALIAKAEELEAPAKEN